MSTRDILLAAKKDSAPTAKYIAVAHSNSPYITAYPWSSSGFGTKFSNPGTLPTDTGYGVAFGV